jgi:hypothetical protein
MAMTRGEKEKLTYILAIMQRDSESCRSLDMDIIADGVAEYVQVFMEEFEVTQAQMDKIIKNDKNWGDRAMRKFLKDFD